MDMQIADFQAAYKKHGPFNLEEQVPYLCKLADRYKLLYERNDHWMDCLKAHSLYNSISTRIPTEEQWRIKAFELQKMYWGENSNIDYETMRNLTNELKCELKSIRDRFREENKTADDLVSKLRSDSTDSSAKNQHFEVMKKISLECSEAMADFSGRIINESMNVLNVPPPCAFETVAIGSIARGEATPYSDLEYLFLITNDSQEAVKYFQTLAVTSYFIMGNLGETKLSYMAIKELYGWFDDKAKNGFKIDGLAEGAGNIPTGNCSKNRNHFIVTPKQLADKYRKVLENPDPKEALRGDITSMLTYTKSLYSYQNEQSKLLQEFRDLIRSMVNNEARTESNMDMLQTDADKFNFVPNHDLMQKGFSANVKKELYRFPSILLLDICIVSGCTGQSSWASLEKLSKNGNISDDLLDSLKFLLAAATYIRLSTYLYHDSHDDRIALTQKVTQKTTKQDAAKISQRSQRWFLPSELFSVMCTLMTPLKEYLAHEKKKDFIKYCMKPDTWWSRVTALYYSGNYAQALSKLKQRCVGLCVNPVESALQLDSVLPHSTYETLGIISDTLYWCSEFRAALQLYIYLTDNNISDKTSRIADCHCRLGDNSTAIDILNSITDKSSRVYFILGIAYLSVRKYEEAEHNCIQALQIDYNNISAEVLTDYYGNPLSATENDKHHKIDLLDAESPEHRLSMITNITPYIIRSITTLGDVYNKMKQYSRAEAYYNKSLQFIYDLYGNGAAVDNAASALNNMGNNYRDMKQYNRAVECYTQALSIYRELSQGEDSVSIANTLNNMGLNYHYMKQYNRAVECYTQALSIYRELSQGEDSVSIANTLYTMGLLYSDTGDNSKARDVLRQALNIYSRLDPVNSRIQKIQSYLTQTKSD